jgi:hypothetical protein
MMKKSFQLIIIALLLTHYITSAQSKNEVIKNTYITHLIKVDGNLVEWADSLNYYDAASKLSYSLGNDNNNLYLAVKTSDPQSIRKILSFGISFSVNKDGKKKEGPTVNFPVVDRSAIRTMIQKAQQANQKTDPTKMNQQIVVKINGIQVTNFTEILDGNISLSNEYGIKAAAALDDKNVFRYELAIPLTLLDLNPESKNILAYNFKLNGMQRTVMEQSAPRRRNYGGYGYGSYDYGDRRAYPRTISETVDFWVKATLATK